jgi:hypothetical protein
MPSARKSSSRRPEGTVRLTATIFGAGPGMGGTAWIEFRPKGRKEEVWLGGSAGGEPPAVADTIRAAKTWRDRVQALTDLGLECGEEVRPEDIRVRGERGVGAAVLAMAWSGAAGQRAAAILVELSDEELKAVGGTNGSLQAQDVIDILVQAADAICADDEAAAVGACIRQALAEPEGFAWETVSGIAQDIAAVAEAGAERDDRQRAHELAPFRDEVDALTAAWWGFAGGATSTTSHWDMSAKQQRLKHFLEERALADGAVPTGQHSLDYRVFSAPRTFTVDLEELRQFMAQPPRPGKRGGKKV